MAAEFGEYAEVVNAWNDTASALGLSRVRLLHPADAMTLGWIRKSELMDDFVELISMLESLPWYLGDNPSGWRVSFRWFLTNNNFLKIPGLVDQAKSNRASVASRHKSKAWKNPIGG